MNLSGNLHPFYQYSKVFFEKNQDNTKKNRIILSGDRDFQAGCAAGKKERLFLKMICQKDPR